MPSFEGETLGGTHFYSAQASDHAMLLLFFSSKAPGCRSNLSIVQRVYESTSEVVAVGVSEDESPTEARRLTDELGIHFPVIVDEGGRISKQYQEPKLPTTFVVDRQSKITWVGGADETEEGVSSAVSLAR
jgi:peroxiredoxin